MPYFKKFVFDIEKGVPVDFELSLIKTAVRSSKFSYFSQTKLGIVFYCAAQLEIMLFALFIDLFLHRLLLL